MSFNLAVFGVVAGIVLTVVCPCLYFVFMVDLLRFVTWICPCTKNFIRERVNLELDPRAQVEATERLRRDILSREAQRLPQCYGFRDQNGEARAHRSETGIAMRSDSNPGEERSIQDVRSSEFANLQPGSSNEMDKVKVPEAENDDARQRKGKMSQSFDDAETFSSTSPFEHGLDMSFACPGPSSAATPPSLSSVTTLPLMDGGDSSSSQDMLHGTPLLRCKGQLEKILETKQFSVQLRVEDESKLQAKTVPEDENRRTDFWISDPYFVRKVLPSLKLSLEHLCIMDYGQQAIMRRSTIIKILSENCKRLKTLDLRNMFLDTGDCIEMPSMLSLTWRCVKVTGGALQDINNIMPNLQTLALLGVFGVERGNLTFTDMKVLCLGLSTPAKDIQMNLPKLEKLQLKMQCPQKLMINAKSLKYVAFNLDVMEPSKVELKCMAGLQEVFLDIPCMALGEDGRFLGVLQDVPLMLPNFSKLLKCEDLEVLNIGPGLWYSMETKVDTLATEEQWPSMSCLTLHMIPQNLNPAIRVLQMLLRPSVKSLNIFVHTSSPVKLEKLELDIEAIVSNCEQRIEANFFPWTKSLDFSCFSF